MAAKFLISGGQPLQGVVSTCGSKNSALPIITAAALAEQGETILENVPHYTDILDLCEILRELGAELEFVDDGVLRVRAQDLCHHVAPYHLARRLRGSTYVMGLLLARLRRGEVACPGGCDIGARPVDFHLKGWASLGAEVTVEHGAMIGNARNLQGNRFYVDRASMGTTINMMITASLAPGHTVLENAAMEPEVVDLANFLNAMGAHVRGAGTNTIRIEGVPGLTGTRHEIIPDRIEVGTYLIAAAATGGDVTVESCIPEHLGALTAKLQEAGMDILEDGDTLRLIARRPLHSVDVETQVYPGFATDLQSPFVALMCLGDAVSVVHETIFENRFGFVNELLRLGANIKVDRDTAIIRGVERLSGAPVEARDLRGGVALVTAALAAEGTTEIGGVHFIDRGYEALERKLGELGAAIRRVETVEVEV